MFAIKRALRRHLVIVLWALTVSGCTTLGPDYQEPEVTWLEDWQPDLYGQFGDAQHGAQVDLDFWWRLFDDPILNSLMETARQANPTLRIAGLRILESRAQLGIARSTLYPQLQRADGALSFVNSRRDGSGSQGQTNYQLGGSLGWELDFWGRFQRSVESADAAFFASITGQQDVQVLLSAQVADLYNNVPARLLIRRPDIRTAAWQVAAQSAQIGIAEADYYPAISLLGNISWSGSSLSGSPNTRTLGGGPAFTWNVFDYGRISNNVRVQDARLQQAIEGFQNAVLQAAREIDDAAIAVVKTAERLARLHEQDAGTISKRQLEVAQASLKQARAQAGASRANIQQAIEQKGGEDDDDNAIVKSAQSAVNKAELDLANTTVTAPSRGIITDLRADVGQYAGTGSAVMTLIAIQDVWINAEFTENNLGHLKVGSAVEIAFDALPGKVFSGKVRSIGLGVSAGEIPAPGTLPSISNNRDWLRQAQRFPVIIGFDTQQPALRQGLRIGAQVSVIAYTEGKDALRWLGAVYFRISAPI